MSKNINQIYLTNPKTSLPLGSLLYLGDSGTDAAIQINDIYNTTNLQLSAGKLNTIQNITTASSPVFAALRLTTGASAGYVLTSDASGNTSWANLGGIGVTSLAGTANQIAASASVGAVTLSLTNGLSIGSYQATSALSGGIIMPGKMAIGQTTANSSVTWLTVNTSTDAAAAIFLKGNNVNGPMFSISNTAGGTWQMIANGSSNAGGAGALQFYNTDGGYNFFINTSLGQVKMNCAGVSIGGSYYSSTAPANGLIVQGAGLFGIDSAVDSTSILTAFAASGACYLDIRGDSNQVQGIRLINGGVPAYIYKTGTENTIRIQITQDICAFHDNGGTCFGESMVTSIPPINGMIMQGSAGFGTNAPAANIRVYISAVATDFCGLRVTGTMNSAVAQTGAQFLPILSPSAGVSSCQGITVNPFIIAPAGQTITIARGLLSNLDLSLNAGVITDAYNAHITSGVGVATITRWTSLLVDMPTAGTTKICAAFQGGISVGSSYYQTAAPSNGMIVQGQTIIGGSTAVSANVHCVVYGSTTDIVASLITGTMNAKSSNMQWALDINCSMQPTGGATIVAAALFEPQVVALSAQTIATGACLFTSPDLQANVGTISTFAHVYINGISLKTGTVTTLYGLLVRAQSAGTNNINAAFCGGISVGDSYLGTVPPTDGAIIKGSVAIGASSATTSAILALTSTTQGFLPPSMTTTQKNAISSPAAGLIVYDNVLLDIQYYNGSSWVSETGVTSVVGTANQIAVSGSSTLTLSLTNGISIGSYQTTTPPSGGIIAPGKVYLGASSAQATAAQLQTTLTGYNYSATDATSTVGIYTSGTTAGIGTYSNHYLSFFTNNSGALVQIGPSGGLVVGSGYVFTAPPTSGAIIQGLVSIGTSAPDTTGTLNLQCAGTKTTTNGGYAYGVILTSIFTPASGAVGDLRALSSQCTFNAAAGQSVANAMGIFSAITPNSSGNTGTITNAMGIYISSGSAPVSGAVTNGYGLYVENPTYGTNKCSVYATNLSVGYAATTPPSSGAIISGQLGVGASSAGADQVLITAATSRSIGLQVNGTLNATVAFIGANDIYTQLLSATLQPSGASTRVMQHCIYTSVNASLATSTTIPDSYSIYIGTGSLAAGTVTRAYGLYVENPGYGTDKCATYTTNLSVGFAGISPPTNGVVISGKVAIGQNSIGSDRYIEVSTNTISAASNFCMVLDGYIGSSTGTIGEATTLYVQALLGSNVGTVTNAYAIHVNGNAATGTVTTGYGIKIEPLAYGTTRYGLFVDTPTGGSTNIATQTANLSVGYTGIAPPSTGAIIQGAVCIGASSPFATTRLTVTAAATDMANIATFGTISAVNSNRAWGIVVNPTLQPTSGASSYVAGIESTPVIISPAAQTIANAYGIYTNVNWGSNAGTITKAINTYIGSGTGGSATISTAYGLYVDTPTCGSVNICAYFQGAIQFGINTTGSNTALLGTTNCPAGTVSAPYNWLKVITPDGSTAYIPCWK